MGDDSVDGDAPIQHVSLALAQGREARTYVFHTALLQLAILRSKSFPAGPSLDILLEGCLRKDIEYRTSLSTKFSTLGGCLSSQSPALPH